MAGLNDLDYYARRQDEERVLAARSADPAVAAVHRDMADRYAALVAPAPRAVMRQAPRPLLRIVTSG